MRPPWAKIRPIKDLLRIPSDGSLGGCSKSPSSCGSMPMAMAGRESVTQDEISQYPLILPLRERVRAEILNWLNREEKDLNIPLSYTLLSNAVLLVEEGLGCAFCLDGALAIHSSPHLRFIPIRPEHTTRSVLVWKKNHLFSPATSLFIKEINMLRTKIE